jgi:hypothetical protein
MTALHPLANGVEHPAPLRHAAKPSLVIAGLFAAPMAWMAQLLISYGLDGDSCRANSGLPIIPPWGSSIWLALIGIIAIAVCGFGFWSAHRTWRLTRGEGAGDHHQGLTAGAGRTRFLGLGGMIAASIFIVGSAFALLVPLLESPCVIPFL